MKMKKCKCPLAEVRGYDDSGKVGCILRVKGRDDEELEVTLEGVSIPMGACLIQAGLVAGIVGPPQKNLPLMCPAEEEEDE